jgi:hypothetical protein
MGAAADEGFDQLPEDGSWAKFYVTAQFPNDTAINVELTMSSVGRLQANGKDCRWIELLSIVTDDGSRHSVYKLLIPEEALKQGPFGPSDAVRAWAAQMENSVQAAEGNLLTVGFVFPDSLVDTQQPDEKESVDWQRGTLECQVLAGTSNSRLGTQDIKVEHRYLLAPDVPFGMGGFKSVVHFSADSVLTIEARLLDAGTGAVSSLPNSQ